MIKAKSKLNYTRIVQGMLIKDLAEKAGISPQGMGQILKGTYSPSPKTAQKICEVLGQPFEEIFEVCEDD